MFRLVERNTYLILRLVAFDRFMALVHYLICAECGFEAAQFNVAFLCEHSPVSHLHNRQRHYVLIIFPIFSSYFRLSFEPENTLKVLPVCLCCFPY